MLAKVHLLPRVADSPRTEQSCHRADNLLLCFPDSHGLHDGQTPNDTIEIEVSLAVQPNEVNRVLRLSGASSIGVGIEQETDVGPRNQSHDESYVCPNHRIL